MVVTVEHFTWAAWNILLFVGYNQGYWSLIKHWRVLCYWHSIWLFWELLESVWKISLCLVSFLTFSLELQSFLLWKYQVTLLQCNKSYLNTVQCVYGTVWENLFMLGITPYPHHWTADILFFPCRTTKLPTRRASRVQSTIWRGDCDTMFSPWGSWAHCHLAKRWNALVFQPQHVSNWYKIALKGMCVQYLEECWLNSKVSNVWTFRVFTQILWKWNQNILEYVITLFSSYI